MAAPNAIPALERGGPSFSESCTLHFVSGKSPGSRRSAACRRVSALLEQHAWARQEGHVDDDYFFTVKYWVLGRLSWLELVDELVWLHRDRHGLEGCWREDGWYLSDEAMDDATVWIMQRTPHQASRVKDERIHHYYDWVQDQVWHYWNGVVADDSASNGAFERLRQADDGIWSFGVRG